MPAGKVGGADVADLAAAEQIVERAQGFFHRGQGVEAVHEVQIDVIGAEPFQAGLAGAYQVVARGALVIRPLAGGKGRLGGNQQLVAPALDGLAENFLGSALGIDIGGIEKVEFMIETEVDHAGRLFRLDLAPALEEFIVAAESAGAETEYRDLETGSAELTIFHGKAPVVEGG